MKPYVYSSLASIYTAIFLQPLVGSSPTDINIFGVSACVVIGGLWHPTKYQGVFTRHIYDIIVVVTDMNINTISECAFTFNMARISLFFLPIFILWTIWVSCMTSCGLLGVVRNHIFMAVGYPSALFFSKRCLMGLESNSNVLQGFCVSLYFIIYWELFSWIYWEDVHIFYVADEIECGG